MQVAALPTSVHRAANSRPTPELSPQAANRLTLIEQRDAMRGEGITAAKAADILRVPRANLYRWKSRLRKRGLRGLEPDSRRPRNVRRPQREPALVKAVLTQRTAPPWFGKDKIAVLLRKKGWKVSASAVGRIIAEAKHRGVLREPPRPGVARRKPRPKRPYAVRKPKTYRPTRPGDLVQIDTLDVRPLPGVILKHFTARDVVSRCDNLASGNASDIRERRAVLGGRHGAHALPCQSDPGGRGLRVAANLADADVRGYERSRATSLRQRLVYAVVYRRGYGQAVWRAEPEQAYIEEYQVHAWAAAYADTYRRGLSKARTAGWDDAQYAARNYARLFAITKVEFGFSDHDAHANTDAYFRGFNYASERGLTGDAHDDYTFDYYDVYFDKDAVGWPEERAHIYALSYADAKLAGREEQDAATYATAYEEAYTSQKAQGATDEDAHLYAAAFADAKLGS